VFIIRALTTLIMKTLFTIVVFFFSINVFAQKSKYLKKIDIETSNLSSECSEALLVKIKTNRKTGVIDSIIFLTNTSTLFSKNIFSAFLKLKEEKIKISKIPLIVLFVFKNESENINFDYKSCLKNLLLDEVYSQKYLEENCIFIGPAIIESGIK
jgi:hypothetical protein